MTEPRRLGDFEGHWKVWRQISDQSGTTALFEGEANWSPTDGGLDYCESGTMTFGSNPPMQAERRYFWADDLSVFFDDGRFFHSVPPTGGEVRHWCDPDDYLLQYDFADWPQFKVFWKVNGPRKAYTAETKYTRC